MSSLALEEYELLEDSKYRAYVASVDKALRNFESTSEWADLISTLGKLNKVLLSHMKYPVVPRRIIISKRLAQCLHPALPSGVHLKSLEIYDVIFKCMGTNRLSQELFIYSAGLFPLFSSAAMNVRSALLMIYENHFVPLGPRLRPGLNGFLAAILSGLEEGSDHFERTSILLQRVGEGVGLIEFFGCLWECILNNANVRLPAISHITNCFNKKLCTEDQLYILGTSIDVMVCGLCRALEDNAVLVQRAALDLTLLLLPMHNTQLLRNDLTAIVTSALTVLLRRDMSLNRRLYAWLLGSEVDFSLLTSEHHVVKTLESYETDSSQVENSSLASEGDTYFQAFSKSLLVDAFTNLLKIATRTKEPPDLRPYKIIIPLLDKPEIGPHILDYIFLDLLRCFYHMCESFQRNGENVDKGTLQPSNSSLSNISLGSKATSDGNRYVNELTKSILLVFSSLQPSYPWYRLLKLLEISCGESVQNNPTEKGAITSCEGELDVVSKVGNSAIRISEVCKLLQYMMTILPLDTQQHLQGAQMPEVLSCITCLFTDYMDSLSPTELLAGLKLCESLLEKLIPSASLTGHENREFELGAANITQNYPLPFSRRPTWSDLTSSNCQVEENGIVQIGIEAGKENQQLRRKEESLEMEIEVSSDGDADDDFAVYDFDGKNEVSLQKEAKSKRGRESVDNKDSEGSSRALSESLLSHVSTKYKSLSDSFETEFVPDILERTNLSEEGFESALGSPDLLEASFLYKYIKDFQKLFLNFVEKLLIQDDSSLRQLEDVLSCQIAELSNIKKLSLLMRDCLNADAKRNYMFEKEVNATPSKKGHFDDKEYTQLLNSVSFQQSSGNYLEVFRTACAILVELSSMPAAATFPCASHANKQTLPRWLIGLLSCIVGGHRVCPKFTQVAISTFLELVALSHSDLSAWKREETGLSKPTEEQGITTLRMLPLLLPTHTQMLLHHTFIFQFMTRELWRHLDASKRECHLLSSELLLQLHSLSLSPGSLESYIPQNLSVVEREILKCLTSANHNQSSSEKKRIGWTSNSVGCGCDSSAIIRWITLWQVSRSISKPVIQAYPYLNRCLFLMVERLRSESVLERSYSQNWLTESLNYGDLGRILDPLLVFLLHPHTRRISVQHVNIEKILSKDSKTQSVVDLRDNVISESQIYAISSVGGEVMYHISKGPFYKGKGGTTSVPAFKKQTLALSSLSKESTNKLETKEVRLSNYEVPLNNQNPNLPISLMINPFSQHPWIDIEDLTNIGRSGNVKKLSHSNVISSKSQEREISIPKELPKPPNSREIVVSILNEMIDRAISVGKGDTESNESLNGRKSSDSSNTPKKETTLHPLHSHMLLYTQLVDVGQCLYGLRLISNILECQPKLFLLSLASTSISSQVNSSPLLVLLARHRRSVFGEGFDGGIVSDMVGQFRSTMYLQVVITVCLYFIRSYYPQQPHLHVQSEHLHDNRELQVVASEVLEALFNQLIPLVADSPRGFSPYVRDLLNKCKVQKCVLHCLLSTAHLMKERNSDDSQANTKTLTQDVLEYNFGTSNNTQVIPQEQPYLFCLMDLTLALIKLEDILLQNKSDQLPCDTQDSSGSKMFSLPSLRYIFGRPIPSQPMFLWTMVLVLNQKNLRHFHSSWISFFTSSLPHTGAALPLNCLRIMTLLCSLLEELASYYESDDALPAIAPPDYTLHLLSGLTNTLHFCLLDPSNSSSTSTLSTSSSVAFPLPPSAANQSPGRILFNLLHVFSPANEVLEAAVDTTALDPLTCTRKTLLSHLPRLLSALLALWIHTAPQRTVQAVILGSRQAVRQQIIELLSPICHHHTPHFLAALGVVWQGVAEGKSFMSGSGSCLRKVPPLGALWKCTRQQRSLVEMLAALRVLPLHTLVENVKQVFRNPPVIEGAVQKSPLEVSILQLFYLYLRETASTSQLAVCWGPFLALVREGILCLPPPALLVLLACLNEFVQRSPSVQDRKEIKEQQDVAVRLLDAVSTIAGSKLEATTWLRRNLTVRPDASADEEDNQQNIDVSSYSVAALSVLADLLAPLLDVLYSSEEKEKVIPLLINITSNVIPYLRNHSSSNMSAFHACSQLLSSLSSYQYTLKAWRKDVLDLLLDPNTFRMLPETLPQWRSLIDNLCTHDKTVFKELLSRISMSQGGSLNLFVSKEAEYETRAGLLKRLAFTIFCSETDQYLKLIPDIQERLTEVTRLGQVVPALVAQVFLCFRVLLLRVSSRGTTSLWPIVITELVQVLLMMEQELSTDTEQFSKKLSSSHLKRLSTLDSRWVLSSQNGLNAHNHPAWLSLYFAACKLLDLMVALPASHLPQFQMYRWAFVGTEKTKPNPDSKIKLEGVGGYLLQSCDFVPHVTRIAKLMNQKVSKGKSSLPPSPPPVLPHRTGHLLLTEGSISSLMDLHPFFNMLTTSGPLVNGAAPPNSPPRSSPYHGPHVVTLSPGMSLKHIEVIIEKDFLEPIFG